MISLSPGLLYSAQRLVDTVGNNRMNREEFLFSFRTILVSPAEGVLTLSTRCGWINIDEEFALDVTEMGRKVQSMGGAQAKLRQQIRDFIQAVQPAWARLLPAGRAESLPVMPPDARQCFNEAGLAVNPPTDDVIAWWDDLAAAARGRLADYLTRVGRDGERCSLKYEERRVGRRPIWKSIESNKSGYDLLSLVSREDCSKLQIEVKASEQPIDSASMHITRTEWEVASTGGRYVFHLWSITDIKRLVVLTPADLAGHVPTNSGIGRWESLEIPFRAFEASFREVPI
ncbi:MAG: protein NO VEIN domain-containing protein [Planctomycetaceae bacterium]